MYSNERMDWWWKCFADWRWKEKNNLMYWKYERFSFCKCRTLWRNLNSVLTNCAQSPTLQYRKKSKYGIRPFEKRHYHVMKKKLCIMLIVVFKSVSLRVFCSISDIVNGFYEPQEFYLVHKKGPKFSLYATEYIIEPSELRNLLFTHKCCDWCAKVGVRTLEHVFVSKAMNECNTFEMVFHVYTLVVQ